MSLTTKFVRKPFYVEAVQVTEENMADVARWCNGTIVDFDETENVKTAKYIKVRVHHPQSDRQTKAFVGDYVLYAGKGYKCYTQKAFLNTFQDLEHKAVEVPQPVIAADTPPKPQAPPVPVEKVDAPGTVRGEDGEVLYDPTLAVSPGITHLVAPADGVTDAAPAVQAAIDANVPVVPDNGDPQVWQNVVDDPEEPVTAIVEKEPETIAPGVEAIGEVAGEPTDLCSACGVTRALHNSISIAHPFVVA